MSDRLTREAAIAAGLLLWRERGEAAVTTTAVGKACDVTHSALYNLFKDADQLRRAVADEAVRLGDPRVVAQLIATRHPAVAGMTAAQRRAVLDKLP